MIRPNKSTSEHSFYLAQWKLKINRDSTKAKEAFKDDFYHPNLLFSFPLST